MNRLDELENAIKNAEESIKNLRNELEQLKKNSESVIPKNVEDIPRKYDFDDYIKTSEYWRNAWIMNYKGKLTHIDLDRVGWKGNMIFPTKGFAEMFREKALLIADCLLFKWMYDRDYVPDWKSDNCNKWYVYKEYSKEHGANVPEYTTGASDTWDENHIYFSSEEIAQKCAEWLNELREKRMKEE